MNVVFTDNDLIVVSVSSKTRTFQYLLDAEDRDEPEHAMKGHVRLAMPETLFALNESGQFSMICRENDTCFVPVLPDVNPTSGIVCLGTGLDETSFWLDFYSGISFEERIKLAIEVFYSTPFSCPVDRTKFETMRDVPTSMNQMLSWLAQRRRDRFAVPAYVVSEGPIPNPYHNLPSFRTLGQVPKRKRKDAFALYDLTGPLDKEGKPVCRLPLTGERYYLREKA